MGAAATSAPHHVDMDDLSAGVDAGISAARTDGRNRVAQDQ